MSDRETRLFLADAEATVYRGGNEEEEEEEGDRVIRMLITCKKVSACTGECRNLYYCKTRGTSANFPLRIQYLNRRSFLSSSRRRGSGHVDFTRPFASDKVGSV